MARSPVRALLLDSGGVLVGPRGGRWNPRFDFEGVVAAHLPDTDLAGFAAAAEAGDAFLAASKEPTTRDDYHRVVLARLGIAAPPLDLLRALDAGLDVPVFDVFPEVIGVLNAVRDRGVDLAVVTDNWGTSATVSRLHDQVGLGGFFRVVVVSEELGCHKPDPRMFDAASTALGHDRDACLFVDDVPELVEAAISLGYRGAALVRTGPLPLHVPAMRTLDEVLPYLV